ncbi:MAG: hypothetical protein WCV90_07180 [Candidatus Woesearchaeota archaeon]
MNEELEYLLIKGNLGAIRELEAQGYRLQNGRELMDARCQDGQEELQKDIFYVADGNVFYRDLHRGALSWAHTNGENNLILPPKYLERALRESCYNGLFRPNTSDESWDAIYHHSSERFALFDLGLVWGDDKMSYMSIITNGYNALNSEQKRAAAAVGLTAKNVAYLSQKGIKETRLCLPNPEYLARVFEKEGNNPFWRASWFGTFYSDSSFNLRGPTIYDINLLRGVRERTGDERGEVR